MNQDNLESNIFPSSLPAPVALWKVLRGPCTGKFGLSRFLSVFSAWRTVYKVPVALGLKRKKSQAFLLVRPQDKCETDCNTWSICLLDSGIKVNNLCACIKCLTDMVSVSSQYYLCPQPFLFHLYFYCFQDFPGFCRCCSTFQNSLLGKTKSFEAHLTQRPLQSLFSSLQFVLAL